jgi:hypothetical protein
LEDYSGILSEGVGKEKSLSRKRRGFLFLDRRFEISNLELIKDWMIKLDSGRLF